MATNYWDANCYGGITITPATNGFVISMFGGTYVSTTLKQALKLIEKVSKEQSK